jgi:hypothetical protein
MKMKLLLLQQYIIAEAKEWTRTGSFLDSFTTMISKEILKLIKEIKATSENGIPHLDRIGSATNESDIPVNPFGGISFINLCLRNEKIAKFAKALDAGHISVHLQSSSKSSGAIGGGYTYNKGTPHYVLLCFAIEGLYNNDDDYTVFNDIRPKLNNIIRHELQHARDLQTDVVQPYDPKYDSMPRTIGELEDYLFHTDELHAYISGFVKAAKTSGKSVIDIIDDFINDSIRPAAGYSAQANDIIVRWKAEVIRRIHQKYPNMKTLIARKVK